LWSVFTSNGTNLECDHQYSFEFTFSPWITVGPLYWTSWITLETYDILLNIYETLRDMSSSISHVNVWKDRLPLFPLVSVHASFQIQQRTTNFNTFSLCAACHIFDGCCTMWAHIIITMHSDSAQMKTLADPKLQKGKKIYFKGCRDEAPTGSRGKVPSPRDFVRRRTSSPWSWRHFLISETNLLTKWLHKFGKFRLHDDRVSMYVPEDLPNLCDHFVKKLIYEIRKCRQQFLPLCSYMLAQTCQHARLVV